MTFAESNHDDFARHSVEDIQRSQRADLLSPLAQHTLVERSRCAKERLLKSPKRVFLNPCQKYDAMKP